MTHDLTLEGQIQQVLNEMLDEGLIPSALNVSKITKTADGYTIRFYDGQTHPAKVSLVKGQSLSAVVRHTLLDHVAAMSGPTTTAKN